MDLNSALSTIPSGLRNPLIEEYENILTNYFEKRWSPAELSAGKFCEIVYTILEGIGNGSFASSPSKPRNFVDACKRLESLRGFSNRSLRILMPRMLPALYEVRNNRGVGHVGGDVNPNSMDANFTIANVQWIMGEFVRIYHNLPIDEAQELVDIIVERKIPLVWDNGSVKRILDTSIPKPDQILIFIGLSNGKVSTDKVFEWLDYKNRSYFNKILKKLHGERKIELSTDGSEAEILPPGTKKVEEIIKKKTAHNNG